MEKKFAKFVSIITVVPIVAFFTITLLFLKYKEKFESGSWYFYSIFFLTILPILAYPLKHVLPSFKYLGRKGERKLAFILAVLGYVLGTVFSLVLKAPIIVKKIFLSYLVSGMVLSFVNKTLNFRASGHACGISGPLTLLYNFLGNGVLWLIILIPLVFWSRLKLGRHSIKELFAGTMVGIVSTCIALTIF